MIYPPNYTEEEVLAIIEKVVGDVSPRYVFGHWDIDDIKQHARLEIIENALPKYKPVSDTGKTQPLANFLYRHVRNRLNNLKRNKFHRSDPPCKKCSDTAMAGVKRGPHRNGEFCKPYLDWARRNACKANLQRPADLEGVSEEQESALRGQEDVPNSVALAEALSLIDQELPIELRSTYLQMRAGMTVPKAAKRQVEQAVKEILCPEKDD